MSDVRLCLSSNRDQCADADEGSAVVVVVCVLTHTLAQTQTRARVLRNYIIIVAYPECCHCGTFSAWLYASTVLTCMCFGDDINV